MNLPLTIAACAVLVTLVIASVQDARSRTVYRITWYPAAVIGIVCAVIFWATTLPANIPALVVSLAIAGIMAVFGIFGLFGKADAKALVLISLAVPVSPFVPSLFPSVAVATLINAGILVLVFALGCLVYNLCRHNRAPFLLMCSGYPVKGSELLNHHGFIAETIEENNRTIERTFRRSRSALTALKSESETMIRTLREHPEKYRKELNLYARCDRIWITAGIPLLVPITIGFIAALCGLSVVDLILNLII